MKITITTKIGGLKYVGFYVFRCLLYLVFLLEATCFDAVAQNNQTNTKISIELKQVNLKTILSILENRTPYYFVYREEAILPKDCFSFSFKDKTIIEICDELFYPLGIDYKLVGIHIILKKNTSINKIIKKVELQSNLVNENNEPAIGVSIYNRRTKRLILSDDLGFCKINSFLGDTIIVSSLKFEPRVLIVGVDNFKKIVLKKCFHDIGEVVVVGFGTRDKYDVTGSISSLNMNEIEVSDNNITKILKGRVSGLYIGGNSSLSRSSGFINVRGISSLNPAVNNPLIVIDDLPMFGMGSIINSFKYITPILKSNYLNNTKVDYMFSINGFERNPLTDISIEDIKSIEILKDAYSTSIFGSRGATGVILIETKKGSRKPRLNFSSSLSLSEPVAKYSLLNAKEYSSLYTQYYSQKGAGNFFPIENNTNWYDDVTRKAIGKELSFSYSGSKSDYSYYWGVSYLNNQSYIKSSDYERYTSRFNLVFALSRKVEIGSNIAMYHSINTSILDSYNYRQSILRAPNVPITNTDGKYIYDMGGNSHGLQEYNTVADVSKNVDELYDFRWFGNINSKLQILPSLAYKLDFGLDWYNGEFYQRIHSNPMYKNGVGLATIIKNSKYVINNTLHYSKRFSSNDINIIVGQSFEKAKENINSIKGQDFSSDNVVSISSAKTVRIVADDKRKWAMFSLFSRLNYTFDNTYQLGLTYRFDGSSRFSSSERYVGFPAMSLGLKLSKFDIIKKLNWFSLLKFRASLGYSGIDGSGGYYGNQGKFLPNSLGLTYGGKDIIDLVEPSNPSLEWEVTKTINLGIDVLSINKVFSLKFDAYKKYVSNLLYVSSVPAYRGFTSQLQNVGSMENSGLEISIKYAKQMGDWDMSSYVNASYNRNIITKLNYNGYDYWGMSDGLKYFVEGETAGVFFLYDWAGVNPDNGNSLWRYSDGTISETPPAKVSENTTDNKYIAGKPLPDWWGGLGTNISYKNISLSVHFDYAIGNKMFNSSKAILTTYTSGDGNNLSKDVLNYWKHEGMETDIPALINKSNEVLNYNSAYSSDRFLEDASYLRLSDVKLSYEFKISKLLKKMKIKRLMLYLQGCNIYTFSHYSGLDPTVSYFGSSSLLAGYDELCLPSVRTYKMGFKISF